MATQIQCMTWELFSFGLQLRKLRLPDTNEDVASSPAEMLNGLPRGSGTFLSLALQSTEARGTQASGLAQDFLSGPGMTL